ncbi:hypothetical protein PACTADRAFT_32813 [Pachysolen tannophilus NRRL Y-2460]|uniref:Uncharacterized protein n=1 Tax=Pachysolen tannophilus NRRL Y-2460 TaxID=669874 RepID=A0A1E4U017_PACTA|nr:hypothetical protein PACTADRAFT_32813 [Pachysolen tannophilus NRRL Y-2460]
MKLNSTILLLLNFTFCSVIIGASIGANHDVVAKTLFQPILTSNLFKGENLESDARKNEDVLVIPRKFLNEESLKNLGLQDLIIHSNKFNFLIDNADEATWKNQELLVPENISALFILNTSDPINIPDNTTSRSEIGKFIGASAPFQLPRYSKLVDYYLVVSADQAKDKNLNIENELEIMPLFKVPIIRQCFNLKPLLVFVFETGNLNSTENVENLPMMDFKNYLPSNNEPNEINTFFDNFAKDWLTYLKIEDLIHSSFCTINVDSAGNSYCIKINEEDSFLELFPAFREAELTNLNDFYKPENIKNSKREFSGNKTSEASKQGMGTVKIQVSDPELKQNFNFKNFTRVNILESEKQLRNYHLKKLKAQKLKQVVEENKINPKEITNNVVASVGGAVFDKAKNQFTEFSSDLNAKDLILIPLSMARAGETKITSPRDRGYSQVLVPDSKMLKQLSSDSVFLKAYGKTNTKNNNVITKRYNERERYPMVIQTHKFYRRTENEEKDCVDITWFNIFHHSIFGKPEFCL